MLKIDNICVFAKGKDPLLNNISLQLKKGQVIGLTGASGAGKTTIMKAILGMLGSNCAITKGDILIDDIEMEKLSDKERRRLCGKTIGFIPQNPMTAFDPRVKIGNQVYETFKIHLKIKRNESDSLISQQLKELNLSDVQRVLNSYPCQISGGMLQRIAVAILLGLKPKYILADEPTSALDEENSKILIEILNKQRKNAGILLVSHDINSLKTLCDKVIVMENGKIIEENTMTNLLTYPQKLWTKSFALANKNVDSGCFAWEK